MKKRIISLILVLVMLCFVFASCDKYSIADEKNLASYASLKNKADFETLLAAIAVEDSDFSADVATRTDKAWDSIYSDLASVVTKDENIGIFTVDGLTEPHAFHVVYTRNTNAKKYSEKFLAQDV